MSASAKAYKGMGMEGGIARWYDRTTRKSMEDFRVLATRIAAMVPAGARVLEVAPGPGFLSIELAKRGFDVCAVDISRTFVELAQKNAEDAGVKATFLRGNASQLLIESNSVDFVMCRAAFKNFTEPVKAMREILRVLRPGGMAMLIDMRRDVSMQDIKQFVQGMGLNWWNRVFTNLTFKHMLIKRAYSLDEIRTMASEAGWKELQTETSPTGFEVIVRKQRCDVG
ncbi:class I SAM-dependent methyltransferase [Terriglobus sp. 2YAB30_2]|uniref:class I SAM-dependent methyltransferase n=2 Tax=unclassified Terriglobus TaxID=2628988 RepID=UPI003F9986B7